MKNITAVFARPRPFLVSCMLCVGLLCVSACAVAEIPPQETALQRSVEQLRSTLGKWNVTTEFLKPDGSVAKSVTGTYEFSWVIPDRVLSGKSEIPELEQVAGILFYINEGQQKIEMVSVAADGRLWIMTGKLGDEVRTTQEYKAADGGTGQLRFTRTNVKTESFESQMEYSEDGGQSWQKGNHQYFRRAQ